MHEPRFELDVENECLLSGGEPVQLTNKQYKLLRYFVQNPNRLLTKAEILENVWPRIHVCEGVIKEYVHDLRVALGDDPRNSTYIETVRGRGYRYIGGISCVIVSIPGQTELQDATSVNRDISIAVLPFADLTRHRDNLHLADGITENLITDLSMSPGLFVITRTSSFVFRDRQDDLISVGRRLGVRYLVIGSLQQDHQTFRITAQLIETATGAQCWAGKYDRERADLFTVRDEITHSIAATLMESFGQIAKAERRQRSIKSPENFTVYDHFMKAMENFRRSTLPPWDEGKKYSQLAKADFTQLVGLSDPPLWQAYAQLAWQHAIDFEWAYANDPEISARLAFENARIAVKNDHDNYIAHWVMGWAYLFFKRDYERARHHYNKARKLNVWDSRLLAEMAQLLIYCGDYEGAITQIKQAIRLNPFHGQWYMEFLAWAYEENNQPEETISILADLPELEGLWSHAILACAYVQTGQIEEARDQIATIDSITRTQFNRAFTYEFWQDWIRRREPYKDPARRTRVLALLEDTFNEMTGASPTVFAPTPSRPSSCKGGSH